MEVWKDVAGYEGLYQVSNFGRVKSLNFDGSGEERIMRPYNVHGYLRVRIFKNCTKQSIGVHRLVALAFIPNPNNFAIVNHIDGNKLNNNAKNLEWCTNSMNLIHAYRVLGCKASGGRPRKKVRCLENGSVYDSVKQASVLTGVNRTSIISCCNGRYSQAGGLHWEYV